MGCNLFYALKSGLSQSRYFLSSSASPELSESCDVLAVAPAPVPFVILGALYCGFGAKE